MAHNILPIWKLLGQLTACKLFHPHSFWEAPATMWPQLPSQTNKLLLEIKALYLGDKSFLHVCRKWIWESFLQQYPEVTKTLRHSSRGVPRVLAAPSAVNKGMNWNEMPTLSRHLSLVSKMKTHLTRYSLTQDCQEWHNSNDFHFGFF